MAFQAVGTGLSGVWTPGEHKPPGTSTSADTHLPRAGCRSWMSIDARSSYASCHFKKVTLHTGFSCTNFKPLSDKRWLHKLRADNFWRSEEPEGSRAGDSLHMSLSITPLLLPAKWLKQQTSALNLHPCSALKLPGQLSWHTCSMSQPFKPQAHLISCAVAAARRWSYEAICK